MTTRDEAVEQLRMIRSLMERATIFRALSGETALIGGAAAVAAAWLSDGKTGWAWAYYWLGGLLLVLVFNVLQLFRASTARGRPFWNKGLRTALRGVLPSLVAGGFLGLLYIRTATAAAAAGDYPHLASVAQNYTMAGAAIWIMHYGIALLAIREFAPRSMVWLGWAFVAFGLYCLAELTGFQQMPSYLLKHLNSPSLIMAVAFGGFHFIYGALIVTTKERQPDPA